jgi:hypothetical protein
MSVDPVQDILCHFGKPEKLSAAQWIFAGLGV